VKKFPGEGFLENPGVPGCNKTHRGPPGGPSRKTRGGSAEKRKPLGRSGFTPEELAPPAEK